MPDSVWSGATVRTADWLSVFPLHPKIAAFFGTRGLASLTSLQFLRAIQQNKQREKLTKPSIPENRRRRPPESQVLGRKSSPLQSLSDPDRSPRSLILLDAWRLHNGGFRGIPLGFRRSETPPFQGGETRETRVSPPARSGNPRKPPRQGGETRGTRDSPRTARETPETRFPGGDSGTPESGGVPPINQRLIKPPNDKIR